MAHCHAQPRVSVLIHTHDAQTDIELEDDITQKLVNARQCPLVYIAA